VAINKCRRIAEAEMSALGQKLTLSGVIGFVRFVPRADMVAGSLRRAGLSYMLRELNVLI
jgi:hypothetical protein